jgi:hypothetical protein
MRLDAEEHKVEQHRFISQKKKEAVDQAGLRPRWR